MSVGQVAQYDLPVLTLTNESTTFKLHFLIRPAVTLAHVTNLHQWIYLGNVVDGLFPQNPS